MSQLALFSDDTEAQTGQCHFCQGELKQIAPRGWLCQSSDRHRFWLLNDGMGVWSGASGDPGGLVSGNSLPDWAVACSWAAVGIPELDGRARV